MTSRSSHGPILQERNTFKEGSVMRLQAFLVITIVSVGSLCACREVGCPDGEVAVEGRCYPSDAVAAVGGGVPILCAEACPVAAPHCDYHTGTCFSCRGDEECAYDTAPVCDPTTRTCTGCLDDADCERFGEVCDEANHRCVECTPDSEATMCPGTSCGLESHRCTQVFVHSVSACGRCATDSECLTGQKCVTYQWTSGGPVESVCLWDATNGCATDSLRAPYNTPTPARSVSGADVTVCAPPTTCYSALAYVERKPCANVDQCANANFSGFCMQDSKTNSTRCTIVCSQGRGTPGYFDPCVAGDVCGISGMCEYESP